MAGVAELKKKWANGEVTYGATIKLGSPILAEFIARSGFDFIKIDMEHGFNLQSNFVPMIQAISASGVPVVVKVPKIEREFIGWVLDNGADGITCPGLESAEEAAYAVSCTRVPPEGIRGATAGYAKYLPGGTGRDVLVIATLESAKGSKNAAEIVSTPGINGVTIGPSDLAYDLGVGELSGHVLVPGPHEDAIKAIQKACKDNGVPHGMTTDGSPEPLKALGCQIIALGTDQAFFERGMQASLALR